jgi:hypothetical protein
MRPAIKYTALLGFLLLMGSCNQNEDLYAPEITFSQPDAGYTVSLPDTLEVKVSINDYRIIRTVVLTLVNEDKIPVIAGKYYYPNNTEFVIETSLPLIDRTLASGPYNLLITVSDGKEQKSQYLKIIIREIPVQLLGYIGVTGQFDFKSTIIKLNPAFEPDTQFVFPHGYVLSAVQNLWGEFIFVTNEPSDLIAFNPETFEIDWEMPAAPPRPLITALSPDQELVFSTENGDAGILSCNGDITLRTSPFENKTIQCLAADDKYVYAAHVSLSGDIHELTLYSRLNGTIWEQRLISGEIRSMVPVGDLLMLFLQSQSGVAVLVYDPKSFTPTQVSFLPDEYIKSSVKISDNQIFIVTEERIIIYKPATNGFENYKDAPYDFCRYDRLNDIIFLARDNMIYGFDRLTGELMVEKAFTEKVLDFQILYNK